MKIKEAANHCHLTEKAIRLYEAKGLIHPETKEINGRTFREYDDTCVRMLQTIGILRRVDFPMELISVLQSSDADMIAAVRTFAEKRRLDAQELQECVAAIDAVPDASMKNIDMLADAIAQQMHRLRSEDEAETDVSVSTLSMRIWDEDFTPSEKQEISHRFWEHYEKKEQTKDVLLFLPRKIKSFLSRLWQHMCASRFLRAAVVLLCIVGCCHITVSAIQTSRLRANAAHQIFANLNEIRSTLGGEAFCEEYTYAKSELILRFLSDLDNAFETAERTYIQPYRNRSVYSLQRALGCEYSGFSREYRAESILHDGAVSAKELQFLRELYTDIDKLLRSFSDDALAVFPVDTPSYGKIRYEFAAFLEKWTDWDRYSPAPYALLET